MADENVPTTVYTDADIERFLKDITIPDERAAKKAFFRAYGELFSAMGARNALAPIDSGKTEELIDRVVEGAAVAAERITG